MNTKEIERFKATRGRRADSCQRLIAFVGQRLNQLPGDGERFTVHIVAANGVTLDRKEGSRAYVQAQIKPLNPLCINIIQLFLRKVQTGRRGRYRAFFTRIPGLIAFQVNGFRIAALIGRNGDSPGMLHHLGEGKPPFPGKADD